jgi:hypothetical protein
MGAIILEKNRARQRWQKFFMLFRPLIAPNIKKPAIARIKDL